MSAGPDDSEFVPVKPWRQWAVDAAMAAVDTAMAADFRTEVLPQWPPHEIKVVRVVPGQEWVKCACGDVLPIEWGDGDLDEAVGRTFRRHLAETAS